MYEKKSDPAPPNMLEAHVPISKLYLLGQYEILYARKLSNIHEQALLF